MFTQERSNVMAFGPPNNVLYNVMHDTTTPWCPLAANPRRRRGTRRDARAVVLRAVSAAGQRRALRPRVEVTRAGRARRRPPVPRLGVVVVVLLFQIAAQQQPQSVSPSSFLILIHTRSF